MASLGAVDLLPPSAIGDLALSVDEEEEGGALEVAFTAPGDDGDGGGAGEFGFLGDWFRFYCQGSQSTPNNGFMSYALSLGVN